jgi:hypothetical protein
LLTFAALNVAPENAYRSQIIFVPASKSCWIVFLGEELQSAVTEGSQKVEAAEATHAFSHLFTANRRCIA